MNAKTTKTTISAITVLLVMGVTAIGQAAVPAPLVYYPFDTAGATTPEFGGGTAGNVNGATLVAGAAGNGNALNFVSANGDNVEVPSGLVSLNGTNTITVSLWLNGTAAVTGAGSDTYQILDAPNSPRGLRVGRSQSGDRMVWDAPNLGVRQNPPYSDGAGDASGAWHMWTFTADMGQGNPAPMATYLDGALALSGTNDGPAISFTFPGDFTIGALDAGNGGGSGWDGAIDEVAIWGEELTAAQVLEVFQNGVIPEPTTALLLGLGSLCLMLTRRRRRA